MAQSVSDLFKDAAARGGKLLTQITCTPPGGEPVPLEWTSGSVTCDLSSASRYTAPLRLAPSDKFDVFDLVTTPGARFAIDTGFDFGAGVTELVGMGRYELAQDSADLFSGDIGADLVDLWSVLERHRFVGAFTPAAGLRSSIIAAAVRQVFPVIDIKTFATGGNYAPSADLSWDSRTEMISALATDGSLDCYFDGSGAFVIREEPTIDLSAPVWSFVTGSSPNIATAERSRPFDRLYNTVVVLPIDETQTWAAQVVELTDINHPLHKSKYGVSIYTYRSPTLTAAAAAYAAAATILRRIQGTTETLSLGSFGMAALEAGDTVSVVTEATETSRHYSAVHLLESFNYDLASAGLTAATRSSDTTEIAEAA